MKTIARIPANSEHLWLRSRPEFERDPVIEAKLQQLSELLDVDVEALVQVIPTGMISASEEVRDYIQRRKRKGRGWEVAIQSQRRSRSIVLTETPSVDDFRDWVVVSERLVEREGAVDLSRFRRPEWYDRLPGLANWVGTTNRDAATARAREFLVDHLSDEERFDLLSMQCIRVRGGSTGRLYEIGIATAGVTRLEGEKPVERLCVHFYPEDPLESAAPAPDLVLALKLMIETQEDEFLAIANHTAIVPPGRENPDLEFVKSMKEIVDEAEDRMVWVEALFRVVGPVVKREIERCNNPYPGLRAMVEGIQARLNEVDPGATAWCEFNVVPLYAVDDFAQVALPLAEAINVNDTTQGAAQ